MKWATIKHILGTTLLVALGGCSHTGVNKVAIVDRRSESPIEIVKPAPRTGLYKVQTTDGDKYLKTPLYLAVRWVQKGDSLGFRTDESGALVAVAGSTEIQLDPLPARVTHVFWLHRAKSLTGFAKSMRTTADFLGKAAIVTGIGVGGAAVIVFDIWCAAHENDSDIDYGPPAHHHHRH